MNFLDRLVENKVIEAIARGELSDLPGEGAPLTLDDDTLIPQELRMAYRILRNAGFVPPEVEMLREIGDLERCMAELPEDGTRARAHRKLQLLRLRLEACGRFRNVLLNDSPYSEKLMDRLEGGNGVAGEDATSSVTRPAVITAGACATAAEGER